MQVSPHLEGSESAHSHAAGGAGISHTVLFNAPACPGGCQARVPRALSCRSGAVRPPPRDLRQDVPCLVLIWGFDGLQGLLAITNWAAENDETIVGEPVHECRAPCPAVLIPDRTRGVPACPWTSRTAKIDMTAADLHSHCSGLASQS